MIKIRVYRLDGRGIIRENHHHAPNSLYHEILNWYRDNVGGNAFVQDYISIIEFKNNEDYNLFRLMFKDKCYMEIYKE